MQILYTCYHDRVANFCQAQLQLAVSLEIITVPIIWPDMTTRKSTKTGFLKAQPHLFLFKKIIINNKNSGAVMIRVTFRIQFPDLCTTLP